MYSTKAAKELEKRGITEGARVEVVALGKRITGTLMPRIEACDSGTLIIKLDNGYNAGVSIERCQSIRKLPQETQAPTHAANIHYDKAKPRVALLATGGTISTRVDYKT